MFLFYDDRINKPSFNISIDNNISFTFVENVASNDVSIDLSGNSVPTLVDLDSDEDLDLIIGQVNGALAFYRNIGDVSQYSFIEETLDVSSMQSNSAPELMDIDSDERYLPAYGAL